MVTTTMTILYDRGRDDDILSAFGLALICLKTGSKWTAVELYGGEGGGGGPLGREITR